MVVNLQTKKQLESKGPVYGMTFLKYLILFIFFSSCAGHDKLDTSSASGAFTFAKQMEEDGLFDQALIQYRNVKNRFPYSPQATLAELQIAEVEFKKEDFVQAQGSYQLFKELHPRHPKIDYVTYQIGESIFYQLPSSNDRDLSLAPFALKEFQTVINNYPQSPMLEKAKKREKEILEKLAQKELSIANFYFRTEQWKPALIRYEKYLKENPKHKENPQALYNASISAKKLKDEPQKKKLFRRLIKNYPQSNEARDLRRLFEF